VVVTAALSHLVAAMRSKSIYSKKQASQTQARVTGNSSRPESWWAFGCQGLPPTWV